MIKKTYFRSLVISLFYQFTAKSIKIICKKKDFLLGQEQQKIGGGDCLC